jgi:hypothetical protein
MLPTVVPQFMAHSLTLSRLNGMVGWGGIAEMGVGRFETIAVFVPIVLIVGAVVWHENNSHQEYLAKNAPARQQALRMPPRWRQPAPPV